MTDMKVADILIRISGDAAEIANNDDRIPDFPFIGAIFTNSHSASKLAIDYNQKDIAYAWMTQKGKAIRQHKTRPYGPDRSIRTIDDLYKILDEIGFDSIVKAVENNLKAGRNDAPLLAVLLDNLRNS